MASPLSRDPSSSVNCFEIHRTDRWISVRGSRQLAEALKIKTENRAPGFAGVYLEETGNGWFRLVPRDTYSRDSDRLVDKTTSQLFLEYALIELEAYLSSLDAPLVQERVKTSSPLKEVRELSVHQLSSRMVRPRLSDRKLAQLREYIAQQRA